MNIRSFICATSCICLVFVLITGCTGVESLDYDDLMPEELEILVEAGRTDLAPKVCYAYARFYLETPYEEWWILGEEYRERVRERFIDRCANLYEATGDRTAACYLENYYRFFVNEGDMLLAELIYYFKGCGKSESFDSFLTKDARVLSIMEHIPTAFNYLSRATDNHDLYERISKVEELFKRYISDLRAVEKTAAIYRTHIPLLIESLKDISITLARIKTSLQSLLNSPYVPEDLVVELSRIRSLISDLPADIHLLSGHVKEAATAYGNMSGINKNLMSEVSKELTQFKQYKKIFMQEYDEYLKEHDERDKF